MEENAVPRHIAFIPDGNRRWAAKNNKNLKDAYETGIKKSGDIVKWISNIKGVEIISFWSFSTENFKRSEDEKSILFSLFGDFLAKGLEEYVKNSDNRKNQVKINFFGKLERFPESVQEKIRNIMEMTRNNSPYTVNFFMGYGGRQEIVDAVNRMMGEGVKEINENDFSRYLYTKDLPDPDVIVRTSGEKRLSGLMPWQSVYSELCFLDKLWPELEEKDIVEIVNDYSRRKRRFGK